MPKPRTFFRGTVLVAFQQSRRNIPQMFRVKVIQSALLLFTSCHCLFTVPVSIDARMTIVQITSNQTEK